MPPISVLSLLIATGIGVSGCAGEAPAQTASWSERELNPLLDAGENIGVLAQRDRRAESTMETQGRIPQPPGIDPAALATREKNDPDAWLSLDAALEKIVNRSKLFEPLAIKPQENVRQLNEAIRLYARGRELVQEGRHVAALSEFAKALQLDPTSVSIMREMAQSFLLQGNDARAVTLYQQILRSDHDDEFALFLVGVAAAERHDFETAIAALGWPRLSELAFSHDPNAELIANYHLARSLRQLGFDRASTEVARATLDAFENVTLRSRYQRQVGALYRQRGELWQAVGDAHYRLGELEEALSAYEMAEEMGGAIHGALLPRKIMVNLQLNRGFAAQNELLEALGVNPAMISEREVQLCAYVYQQVDSVELLQLAVDDMYRRNPEHAALARAAASLRPDAQGRKVLKDFLSRRPRDLGVVRQLLVWIGKRNLTDAIRLTADLLDEHPDLAQSYVQCLMSSAPRPEETLTVVETMPSSPALQRVRVGLLTQLGALGEAWSVCREGLTRWRGDAGLQLDLIVLAGELDEPALVDSALAEIGSKKTIAHLIAGARAQTSVARTEQALKLAGEAMALEPDNPRALTELARANALIATTQSDPNQVLMWAEKAISSAANAIELDPTADEPYGIISRLTGLGGVVADRQRSQRNLQNLQEANPNSLLLGRLLAQNEIAQRRHEQALDRLVDLYESNPAEKAVLALAMSAWTQLGHLGDAEQWLEEKLRARPGDPGLLEYWVRAELLQNRPDKAIERLLEEERRGENNHVARRLLESTYQARGELEQMRRYREPRLKSRPRGTRREMELARLYADAGDKTRAMQHIRWIEANAPDARREHLFGAINVARELDPVAQDEKEIVSRLILYTLDRYPNSPMSLYTIALTALAKQGERGDLFDDLVQRTIDTAPGALELTQAGLLAWRDLAQSLLDVGAPELAGRALRQRIAADAEYEDRPTSTLAVFALAADAATPNSGLATVQLVNDMLTKGQLGNQPSQRTPRAIAKFLYEVSQIHSLVGNVESTDYILLEVIRLDPEKAMAMNNLAYMRSVAGRHDEETIALMESAYERLPEDANVLDSMGWMRYRLGIFEDQADPLAKGGVVRGALGLIQEAVEKTPSDREPSAEVLSHLADTFWRTGQKAEAEKLWRKVEGIIGAPQWREARIEAYRLSQTRSWSLLMVDPEEIYLREDDKLLKSTRSKIKAVEEGRTPELDPTFEEAENR